MLQVTNGHEALNGWRTESMYSFSEAASLAGVSPTTVKNWLFGYKSKGRDVPPLFAVKDTVSDDSMVSFLQMIEIMVAGRFRKSGMGKSISFDKVRGAYVSARNEFGLVYPFAHMRLEQMGGHIVHFLKASNSGSSFQALDVLEKWTLPGLVQETVQQIEYESDLASRWFPVGKNVPIVVDPKLSAGLPVIEGRGVTVQAVRRRFTSGLDIEFIAKDFDIDPLTVQEVIRYGEKVAA